MVVRVFWGRCRMVETVEGMVRVMFLPVIRDFFMGKLGGQEPA